MKIPLRFQTTEYDCGTTTYINALSYLFEREEIPVALLKAIYNYTLDAGESGTSSAAMNKLTEWIRKYSGKNNFNIMCEMLEKTEVNQEKIQECLNSKGCVIARCYLMVEHYVLITKTDNNYAYIFDPYYLKEDYYFNDKDITIVTNQQFTHNRVVKLKRLFSQSNKDLSLMEIDKRSVILLNKSNKKDFNLKSL